MLSQEKLLKEIDNLIAEDKLPRFSIVLGDRGMYPYHIARYIANQYQGADYIQLQDVKVDTIRNMIKQAYTLHNLTFFCIPNADDMSVNAKNAILKVIEEPPNRAYFVLCLEDINNTLATILSRGTILRMCSCKPHDIREFARSLYVNKSDIDEREIQLFGELCNTPGDVVYFTKHNITEFNDYVDQASHMILEADGAEAFKIADKLALKDEEDKWDVRLFLRALQTKYWEGMCDYHYYDIVLHISKYLQDLKIKGINKGMLIDMMILDVRKVWKSQM